MASGFSGRDNLSLFWRQAALHAVADTRVMQSVEGKCMTETTETSLGTVARSIEILRYFAKHNEASIKSLSSDLGLAPSTCHQLLHLFVREGIIEHLKDVRRYRIGAGFFRLSSLVIGADDVRTLAMPLLRRIVAETDETALLCRYIQASGKMIFAEKVDSSHMLRYEVPLNEPTSVLWGASGRSILAFLPDEEVDSLFASQTVSPASGDELPDIALLREELKTVRERGYAITFGQKIAGAVGINAPVFAGSRVIGSIGVTVPQTRITEQHVQSFSTSISAAAAELSTALDEARGNSRKPVRGSQ